MEVSSGRMIPVSTGTASVRFCRSAGVMTAVPPSADKVQFLRLRAMMDRQRLLGQRLLQLLINRGGRELGSPS